MLISMNWICDFVDLSGLDKLSLIRQFSLSTAEVENDIFFKGSDVSGVVLGEILSAADHPESDHLHLLKVDVGQGAPVDIVCGAPNVRVGMRTAVALPGARLGEVTITPQTLAGCPSNGMCCSEHELGISDDNSGIMDIESDAANGTDLKELFAIDDIVFEVDNKSLTNRPDLWGHYGIAREFAALSGRPLRPMDTLDLSAYDDLPAIDMKIEDPLCQRYSCLQVDHITKTVSPVNMRIRLFYCGMRGINLLADLTNYLMLEMGQPMHAFDSRTLEHIRIRRFDKPFTFQTLDGVERSIDENTLMICNGDKPVGIAGIMGGLDSEIVDDTTALTLESATFDAVSIRKSTVRLGHRTDASMRYEKSLDPEMTTQAIARFTWLLQQIDPGARIISRLTDEYAFRYPDRAITFDKRYVDRMTGIEIGNDTILRTLRALGFGAELEGETFHVTVPSWRGTKDVTMKADIIEEITRIYGYDNFDVHTAVTPLYPIRADGEKTAEDRIKDLLVKRYSLHEVHSYVWAYADEYRKLGIPVEDNVKLVAATNPNIETIRRSMVPTQLCQVKVNTNFAPTFGIFEIGRVVDGLDENNLCREHKKLCVTLFSRQETTQELYFRLRDMVAVMMDEIRHRAVSFRPIEATHAYQHPRNLNAVVVDGVTLGEMGVAHPAVARRIDKKAAIVYLELDMGLIGQIQPVPITYAEPSRYPGMEVDLTFLAPRFAPIAEAISQVNSPLMKKADVVDIYTDESGKAITVHLSFSHPERTLKREETQSVVDAIVAAAAERRVFLKSK